MSRHAVPVSAAFGNMGSYVPLIFLVLMPLIYWWVKDDLKAQKAQEALDESQEQLAKDFFLEMSDQGKIDFTKNETFANRTLLEALAVRMEPSIADCCQRHHQQRGGAGEGAGGGGVQSRSVSVSSSPSQKCPYNESMSAVLEGNTKQEFLKQARWIEQLEQQLHATNSLLQVLQTKQQSTVTTGSSNTMHGSRINAGSLQDSNDNDINGNNNDNDNVQPPLDRQQQTLLQEELQEWKRKYDAMERNDEETKELL
mmetsp:Transcript_8844/g.14716  ORF Transcript_8844/g.14716 Transcript_8844/m.14716 type:complete len:255 (+) Transcript_8844:1061-1825(+)